MEARAAAWWGMTLWTSWWPSADSTRARQNASVDRTMVLTITVLRRYRPYSCCPRVGVPPP